MEINLKDLIYKPGADAALDAQFAAAKTYHNVRLGETSIFWKRTFHWYSLPLSRVQRVYRRVEEVRGRLCCGGANFDIQRLMLCLTDGSSLEITIGDSLLVSVAMQRLAEDLYSTLKEAHPELQYGKV